MRQGNPPLRTDNKTMSTHCLQAQRFFAAGLTLLSASALHADYSSTVLSDSPKAYYRLNDDTSRTLVHTNLGSLGSAGNAIDDPLYYKGSGGAPTTNATGVVHSFPGAAVGDRDRSAFFDFTTRAESPWNEAFNTPNTQPFTIEAWL